MEGAVVTTIARYDRDFRVSFVDDDGSLYMTMGNNTIKKRNLDGTLTAIAGVPNDAADPPVDGPVAAAKFVNLLALTKGPDGALYVADTCLLRVIRDGMVTTLAGHVLPEDSDYQPQDGVGTAATIISADNIWFFENRLIFWDEDQLREVSLPGGVVTTIGEAGSGNALVDQISRGRDPNSACDNDGNCYSAALWPSPFIKKTDRHGAVTYHGQIGVTNIDGPVAGDARFIGGFGTFAYDAGRKILYLSDSDALRMIKFGPDDPVPLEKIALPPGTVDIISQYPIPYDKETRMVDFHGERGYGRYYTRETYDHLNTPQLNPYTHQPILPHVPQNPVTRRPILPGDLTEYIAYIDPTVTKQAATKIQSLARGVLTRKKKKSKAAAGGRRKTRRRRTRRHSRR